MNHTSASIPTSGHLARGTQGASSRGSLLHALEMSLSPLVAVGTLWTLAMCMDGGIHTEYFLLGLAVFVRFAALGPSLIAGALTLSLLISNDS